MDPITLMFGLASTALSAFGTFGAMQTANQASQINQQIAGIQVQENTQRQLAMQISARTKSLDALRNTQKASSLALAAGVNQGAQFGSGVAGGQGAAANQGAQNLENIQQNLQIGNALFGMDSTIDNLKGQLSALQSREATYSGISSLGGDLSRVAGPFGNLFQNFFGGSGGGGNSPGASSNYAGYNVTGLPGV